MAYSLDQAQAQARGSFPSAVPGVPTASGNLAEMQLLSCCRPTESEPQRSHRAPEGCDVRSRARTAGLDKEALVHYSQKIPRLLSSFF